MSEANKKLLIVDDDIEICKLLSQFLHQFNFDVITAHDGVEMFAELQKNQFDLIILDMMLPGDDGITLCRKLQGTNDTPILMLSAAGSETDRIIGLEVGADDYLAKPFNPRELLARIKAILRRRGHIVAEPNQPVPAKKSKRVRFNNWTLDLSTRQLFSPTEIEIIVSSGEFDLLVAFLENAQQVLSRDQLLDYTKNRDAGPFDRSIDMQVSRLRQKIEDDPRHPALIKTVRGGGYLFTAKVESLP
jgi:two-component system OmpR family response regulator